MKLKAIIIFMLIVTTAMQTYARTNINEARELPSNGRVYVDNVSGSVSITGWNKNEVSIKGSYGGGVERVEIHSSANSIRIKVIYRFGWIFDSKCDLEINAPEKADLNISTVNARITVENFSDKAEIESISGGIEINGNFSSLEARSTSGELKVDGDNGNLELRNTSGKISVNGSANDADVTSISGNIELEGKYLRVKAKTVSGDIDIEGEDADFADLHSTSGSIKLGCTPRNKADIYAETTSGSIELNTTRNLSAKLKLESFSGRIKIEGIDYDKETNDDEDNFLEISKSLRMTVGKGDAKIYLQSLSGSISINGE